MRTPQEDPTPTALLLGDLDMVHPLQAAGIPVTALRRADDTMRYSRRVTAWIDDDRPDDARLVARLLRHAETLPHRPVIYYEDDPDLAFVHRWRDALSAGYDVVLPDHELVADLLDKQAFQALARRLDLPVPQAVSLGTDTAPGALPPLAYPVLVKPLGQGRAWGARSPFDGGKALLATDRAELGEILAHVRDGYARVLGQQYVPGPESRIESYHVYVDAGGAIAAEFTGQKLRTHPEHYGFSTALITTDHEDVRALGGRIAATLGLRGVAKMDFKRDDDGRLWLLEVNPRFNLWHRLGAVAGCNIPATVHADLTGRPRPAHRVARPGVTWCWMPRDLLAARAQGVAVGSYLRWLRTCDAVAGFNLTDPMPFLRGRLLQGLRDRLGHRPTTA